MRPEIRAGKIDEQIVAGRLVLLQEPHDLPERAAVDRDGRFAPELLDGQHRRRGTDP